MLDPRVAVVVGRFQIDKIHRGHEIFLSTVLSKHDNLVIFVGVHSGQNTKNNPMGYLPRAQMLRNALKELSKDHSSALVTIEPLPDMSDDTAWSKELDRRIAELYPRCKVVLYGGRDSCLMYYNGIHTKQALYPVDPSMVYASTTRREEIKNTIVDSDVFRAGIIYGAQDRFPIVYPTVDVAVVDPEEPKVLMARKPNETKFRFIGGFVDVKDYSYEVAAIREVKEEANIKIENITYIASRSILDFRYKNTGDSIQTTLFAAMKVADLSTQRPQDDIEELKWFYIDTLEPQQLVPCHESLWADCKQLIRHYWDENHSKKKKAK